MGDSDSSDFDVITVKESEAALPVARGLLMKEKPGGAASFSWEKSLGCCQVLVRHKMSSLQSAIKSAISRALLLRDLIFSRQSFRQVSGVVALSRGDSTL